MTNKEIAFEVSLIEFKNKTWTYEEGLYWKLWIDFQLNEMAMHIKGYSQVLLKPATVGKPPKISLAIFKI